MFTRKKSIIGSTRSQADLSSYIDGFDVYNSLLLKYLTSPDIDRIAYRITENEYRPDLIAKAFYGSEDYTGILMIQCGLKLEDFVIGKTLYLIPKNAIDSLLKTL